MNNELLLFLKRIQIHVFNRQNQDQTKHSILKYIKKRNFFLFTTKISFWRIEMIIRSDLFGATNSVSLINEENGSFSISIPGCWRNANYLEDRIIDKLKNLLKLRYQNDIELLVEEVRKRGDKIKIESKEYCPPDFDTSAKRNTRRIEER